MAVGQDIPRIDGLGKLLGAARYVDDLKISGLWHGGTIRSHVARGVIKKIRFNPAVPWGEFIIVDHRDIPGPNEVLFLDRDQPALAAEKIHHMGEPVLLIAHRSMSALRRALRAVRVEIDPLPPIFDPRQKLTADLIQYGKDNVFKRIDIVKGDVEAGFGRAAHIIEGEYHTGAQEHVYLETQGMIAYGEEDRMVIRGTMQCPYYVLNSLKHLFNRPVEAFRVIQTPTGGGFGGKEDYPSIIAIHAALLAEKADAPVKIVYDRHEDMAATTKRHPSWVRHRTALDKEGKLLAMDIDVLLDGGAYVTLSPVVLSRGVIHAAGPYYCENIRIHGEARFTNSPPNGAFRGFGAPQTLFAVERHMNVIADQLGIDPVELRRRNLLRPGQTTATGQVMKDQVDLPAVMDRALASASYRERRARYAHENQQHPYLRKGIGFATFLHGSGFTGSGETYLASEVWVEGLPDGRIEVLTANTDMGQGTETILMQIAAEAMQVSEDRIVINLPDTSRVPNSGPTVASRTAMVVGRLIDQACEDLRRQVALPARQGHTGEVASDSRVGRGSTRERHSVWEPDATSEAIRAWHLAHPGQRLIGKARYAKPPSIQWDEDNYRGDAYACFSWAAHVAEVEVDLRTCGVRVTDYVALQEVGKVINPTLARGQVQGGVVQGIGWALMEEVVTEDGMMKNSQLTNYIIPGSADLPPIRVFFEEVPSEFGPQGAKGIGELPIDGPAPAIINAVCDALGVSISSIPLTPERLEVLMRSRDGKIATPLE